MFAACKKKEAPAVIEEVPATSAPTETDTSATLTEEPALKQVGKGAKPGKEAKAGSAKATFHPSASSASSDKAGFSEQGHFVVQVSVFKSKAQAAKLVEKLAGAGYPAYVAEVENPVPSMPGTYHRVRIGNFARIADAKAFGDNTLAPMGYQFWVDNKKNDAVGGDGSNVGPAPEAAPEPAPRAARHGKSKAAPVDAPITSPSEPAAPSEPSVPAGETWGTPKTEEPAAPAGETWGTPAASTPVETAPATPAHSASKPAASSPTPSAAPATKNPADTGKVNLDEW